MNGHVRNAVTLMSDARCGKRANLTLMRKARKLKWPSGFGFRINIRISCPGTIPDDIFENQHIGMVPRIRINCWHICRSTGGTSCPWIIPDHVLENKQVSMVPEDDTDTET